MFNALVKSAREADWQTAVRDHLGPAEAYAWTVEDHRAAAPIFALPAPESRVLDLSCGRGTFAFALASTCRAVYATDPDPDAVRFVAIRARQIGISNILPLLTTPEPAIRRNSLDLILARELPSPDRLHALVQLLKPGGRFCVGLPNPHFPLSRTGHAAGAGCSSLKSALSLAGLCTNRIFIALPNASDARFLIDAADSRGMVRLLKERYPKLALLSPLGGPLLYAFRRTVAPGYWAVGQKGPQAAGQIEQAVQQALKGRVPPNASICTPLIYANRGTFTWPVFINKEPRPVAIFRMDAARSLVRHEASVLRFIAKRGDPWLGGSVPDILWEGRFGLRNASLQTVIPGRPLAFPKTAACLERQLDTLAGWLKSLYQISVSSTDLVHPHLSKLSAIYEEKTFQSEVTNSELADRFWKALDRLLAAGLRPSLVHGDLHPHNILTTRRRFAVLDWEYATRAWLPFDWLHYVCCAMLDDNKRSWATPHASLGRLTSVFEENNPRCTAIRRATGALLRNVDLDPVLYPEFFIVGVFDFIRRRFNTEMLGLFLPLFRQISCL